jgi:hypothetical protein
VLVKLIPRLFAFLIAVAYLGATVLATAPSIGSCPILEDPLPSPHHHHGGHPHDSSGKTAGDCLKCCLWACLVAPCLPGPTLGISELAFVGSAVLYSAVSPAIYGRAITPDPGPPKPIT